VAFQGRETVNQFYTKTPVIVQEAMDKFATLTGRQYPPVRLQRRPDAERVIIIMGSGAETVDQTAAYLNAHGEKTGVVKSISIALSQSKT